MWVNKQMFDMIVADNKAQAEEITALNIQVIEAQERAINLRTQKAKDDISIDWLRHRVNALEKQSAVLMNKAAGILLPVPEIVPTRPGTMSDIPDFDTMPSFEDVGDTEAQRLKVKHDEDGNVLYQ
jgi:hypothetical protein